MLRVLSVVISFFSFLTSILVLIFFFAVDSFAQPAVQFIPSITLSEEYDSNVYSASSASEDYVSKIGTNLAAAYTGANVEFNGGYQVSFNSYASQPEANVFTHGGNLNIGLNRWFQKFSKGGGFTISEGFTFTPDLTDGAKIPATLTGDGAKIPSPLTGEGQGGGELRGFSDESTLSNYGIKTVRSDTFRNSAGFNITIPFTQSINLNTSYSNTLTDYRGPLYKDNTTNTLGLGAAYSLKKDIFYSNISIGSARAGQEDSINYSLTFGLKHPFSQSLSIDGNAGFSIVAPETGKKDTVMRGSIGLSKQMEWHTLSADYSRSLNTTTGISGTPVVADVYSLNLTNIHSQYLSSGIGVNYSYNKSIKGSAVDTQSYNINGNLNYIIRKWLTCSFSIAHFSQTSQIALISEMKRNQITLSLISKWL